MREGLMTADSPDRKETPPVVINFFEETTKIKQTSSESVWGKSTEIRTNKTGKIKQDSEELRNEMEYLTIENNRKTRVVEQSNEKLERMLNDIKTNLESVKDHLIRSRSILSHSQRIRLETMVVEHEREERRKRRLDIVVNGMSRLTENDDPVTKASEFIEMYFKLRNCVYSARLFGNEGQYMIIKLKNVDVRNEILRNKSILKGSGIFIRPHFTLEQEILHKRLKKIGLEARELGKDVKFGYSWLVIDNIKYIWNNKTASLEIAETPLNNKFEL